MDPYKVLGVTPETSDDDVKRAYRELARKYHPDNYVNSPLSDLAESRMKEINEAYDMIMGQRNGKQSNAGAGYSSYNGQQAYTGANAGIFQQVRQAINQGNLGLAENLLSRIAERDAEWHFLMGTIYHRKGWFDEASRFYEKACQMNPANLEYRRAYDNLKMSGQYGGYRPMDNTRFCDCCTSLLLLNCCTSICCGGRGC